MNNSRAFLHITYKLYGHLDKLSGVKKSNCINCYLSLMKHAWKKNNYECGLRYSTVAKETKLSRITVRRTLDTLEKLNVISTVRGRSGKTYKINQLFIKSESDGSILYTNKPKMYKKDHSNVKKRSVLEETIYINNIDKIIRDNRNDKDSLILNLSKLPLSELKSDTKNPYYIKLAIEKKAELDRESKATYVHPQKIINELTKISKNSNPRYREKVAFNKRNNLDYKGRPIIKDNQSTINKGRPKKW
jgi:DNA-binding transcriptional regulator YhcF (GntR family)